MNILITAVIALSGLFGASFMAESSVPGDILYPVKINVNENMKHAVAFTAESEAKVSEEIIARRAEEAQKLEAEGKLYAETKSELTAEINAEIMRWKKNQEEIKASGNTESETNVKASFTDRWNTNKSTFQMLNISVDGNMNTSSMNSGDNDSSANMNGSVDTNMSGSLNSNEKEDNTNSSATGTASGLLEIR